MISNFNVLSAFSTYLKVILISYMTIGNTLAMSVNHSTEYEEDASSDYAQFKAYVNSLSDDIARFEEFTGFGIDDIVLSPTGLFGNIGHGDLEGLGHSLNDFVLSCRYMSDNCDMERDWVHFLHPDYFNCYTYVGGTQSGKIATGPNNGLSIVLYLENIVNGFQTYNKTYNVYSNIQNAFGVRLDIHGPDTLPTPSETGIDAMPGHSTSIGMQQKILKKLPLPWGDCTGRKSLKGLNEFAYTTKGCLEICRAKYVYDKCDCIPLINPVPDNMANDNYRHCMHLDNTSAAFTNLMQNTQCNVREHKEFVSEQTKNQICDCKEACNYRSHDILASASIWPASIYNFDMFNEYVIARPDANELLAYNQLIDTYTDAYHGITDGTEFSNLINQNFARINIYFETQKVIEIRQSASMTLADLFANVGGAMGLWAGLSIVTVIEVMSLLFSLCAVLIRKCKTGNRKGVLPIGAK